MNPLRRLAHLGRLAREIWGYAWRYRAWWLIPVIAVLFLLALLAVVATKAAVFSYTLF